MEIHKDAYTGFTALDLIAELTPPALKSEALWWAHADGNRGKGITYVGKTAGMSIWECPDGTRIRLRSKPAPLTREEHEQIEAACKVWMERQWHERIEEYRKYKRQTA